MSVTLTDYVTDLIKISNYNKYKSFVSTYLQSKTLDFGTTIFSPVDFATYPFYVDASTKSDLVVSDLTGLIFFKNLKTLILPAVTLPINSIDLTNFPSIQIISSSSNPTVFKGDMSPVTSLTYLKYVIDDGTVPIFTPPNLGANLNLTYVSIFSVSPAWTITQIGNLSGLTKLTQFLFQNNTAVTQSTINNILSTLRAAKVAGAPLTVVNLNGTKAPTGGSSNVDAVWLSANGVTLTLGTL